MCYPLSRASCFLSQKRMVQFFLTVIISVVSLYTLANISRSDLTAAYLFRLAENIQWRNAASISQYRIHLIDNGRNVSQALKNIARGNKLHGKPFRVTQSRSTSVPNGVHLVYLAKSKSNTYADVIQQIEGKNILLVSEDITNKRQIMINLFETASKQVKFEINKANILNQNLGIL